MSHWTISRCRSRATARRLLTLFMFGWLGLVVQPCSAAAASACLNCPSQQGQDHCVSHLSNPCVSADGAATQPWPHVAGGDVPQTPLIGCLPVSLSVPAARHVRLDRAAISPGGDGPSLKIRFCSYNK